MAEVLHSGTLQLRINSKWQHRHCQVLEGKLQWLRDDTEELEVDGELALDDFTEVRIIKFGLKKFMFEVESANTSLRLAAAGDAEKLDWIEAIEAAAGVVTKKRVSVSDRDSIKTIKRGHSVKIKALAVLSKEPKAPKNPKNPKVSLSRKAVLDEERKKKEKQLNTGVLESIFDSVDKNPPDALPVIIKDEGSKAVLGETPEPEAPRPSAAERLHEKLQGNLYFVASAVPKCTACKKKVYGIEQVIVDGKKMHKDCFRCAECSTKLQVGTFSTLNDKYFCRPHYLARLRAERKKSMQISGEDMDILRRAQLVKPDRSTRALALAKDMESRGAKREAEKEEEAAARDAPRRLSPSRFTMMFGSRKSKTKKAVADLIEDSASVDDNADVEPNHGMTEDEDEEMGQDSPGASGGLLPSKLPSALGNDDDDLASESEREGELEDVDLDDEHADEEFLKETEAADEDEDDPQVDAEIDEPQNTQEDEDDLEESPGMEDEADAEDIDVELEEDEAQDETPELTPTPSFRLVVVPEHQESAPIKHDVMKRPVMKRRRKPRNIGLSSHFEAVKPPRNGKEKVVHPFTFKLDNGKGKLLTLHCSSDTEREQWITRLANAVHVRELEAKLHRAQRIDMMSALQAQAELENFRGSADFEYRGYMDLLTNPKKKAWKSKYFELAEHKLSYWNDQKKKKKKPPSVAISSDCAVLDLQHKIIKAQI